MTIEIDCGRAVSTLSWARSCISSAIIDLPAEQREEIEPRLRGLDQALADLMTALIAPPREPANNQAEKPKQRPRSRAFR